MPAVPAGDCACCRRRALSASARIGTPLLALLEPPWSRAHSDAIIAGGRRGLGSGPSARTGADAFWRSCCRRIVAIGRPGCWPRIFPHSMVRIPSGVITSCFCSHTAIGSRLLAHSTARASRLRGTSVGDRVRLHLDAVPGRRPAVSDARAAQNLCEDDLRRQPPACSPAVNVLKGCPNFALGQFSTEAWHLAGAAPMAIATQFLGFWVVRITTAGAVLQITMALMLVIAPSSRAAGVTDMLRG